MNTGQGVCLNYRPSSTDCYSSQWYPSVIDVQTGPRDATTGIAVQAGNGNLLAVAHSMSILNGHVSLFDKNTGALLATLSIPQQSAVHHPLNQLAFDANGNLWVTTGTVVQCYTTLLASGGPVKGPLITGFSNTLAVAASPTLPVTVLVADGGQSQTVKAFDGNGVAQ